MFRRLFLFFLVFLGMGPHVWAEGIISVICATEQLKGCKSINYIYEYNWDNAPNNRFRKNGEPAKVYAVEDSGYVYEYNWDNAPNNRFRKNGEPAKPPIKVYSF